MRHTAEEVMRRRLSAVCFRGVVHHESAGLPEDLDKRGIHRLGCVIWGEG